MADNRLRSLERRDRISNEVSAAQIAHRVRVGSLPVINVQVAAHFGHQGALDVVGCDQLLIDCSCNKINYCFKCTGTNLIVVPTGLTAAICLLCPSHLPVKLIAEWACDCVEAAIGPNNEILRSVFVDPVRNWCQGRQIEPTYHPEVYSGDYLRSACLSLRSSVMYEQPAAVNRLTNAVSYSYHAQGHTMAAREWQISRLCYLMLR